MLGQNIDVKSWVVIDDGCPIAISKEGTDHLRIACGTPSTQMFELLLQPGALAALVEAGLDALQELDGFSLTDVLKIESYS